MTDLDTASGRAHTDFLERCEKTTSILNPVLCPFGTRCGTSVDGRPINR